jgi:glucose/arabinose dehydrogenase
MKKQSILIFVALLIYQLSISQTFPPHFSREQVGGAITNPTVMAFANDGRIFVAEQSGKLRVIKNGTLLAASFVTLTVNSNGERGLIGIALDPDFATNNFIYLYYTVNTAPLHNRISRFTANGDEVLANSEQIILELDNLSGATNHNGGALSFGLDGKLYVAIGENATPANAQNLDTYHGKLLRINKDGTAPADNPFNTSGVSEQKKRVWSYGLRNPFTFSVQPITGKIFLNEVGQSTWEEINDASVGSRNFGWPTTEGATTNAAFTTPVYSYNHSTGTPTGCAITGGTFFNPTNTNYPTEYIGKYFFQDYCSNWIYWIDPTASLPTATSFGSSVGGSSVSITAAPDGNLYYLSRGVGGMGALYRIKYTVPTLAPTIIQQPSALAVSVGQPASFTVTASGTAPLTYQWKKDNTDIQLATESTYSILQTQLADAGSYKVEVTNSAGSITSNAVTLTVNTLPNTKPSAKILTPIKNTLYVAGTTINFSGQANDPEDGNLPASAFSWQINFHHDTHKHDQPAINGVKESSFEIPNQGETSSNVWYRIILTVNDSQGLTSSDSVDVYPKKSMLTFTTDPEGLQIMLDGQPIATPNTIESVQGLLRSIGVVSPQRIGTDDYQFASWSNGGNKEQQFATPTSDAVFKATFSVVTGTENLLTAENVFPNPASDWIYINKKDDSSISIQNAMGQVWEMTLKQMGDYKAAYVGDLSSGLYFIKSDDSTERIKIIIQR